MLSVKSKNALKIVLPVGLIILAALIIYDTIESRRIDRIDAVINEMRQELQENLDKEVAEFDGLIKELEKNLDMIDKQNNEILRKSDEESGPYFCQTCTWPMSLRAKICTNCGAPR